MIRFSRTLATMALFCTPAIAQQAANKFIECAQYAIPTNTTSGSGYTAIEAGLDGKIYVGTANYGGSAHIVQFDPRARKWRDIIDAHKVTRWNGTGLDSFSKFHAKIVVDADGTIWAASKQGNEEFGNRPEYGENPTGHPGAHLFSYDPKAEIVQDHGILLKQEGFMGGVIDRQRRRIYYRSDPKSHLVCYDITSNTVRDLGQTASPARYMAIDPRGRVFLTGRKGILCMYDPEADELYDLAVQREGPGTYVDPYVVIMSADGSRIFGCVGGGEYVMEFDLESIRVEENVPGANGTIICHHVARSIPEPLPFGGQHAGTLGKDGSFYFPNVSDKQAHLIRYDPKRRQIEDLGVMRVKGKPDQKLTSAQGACVSADGTLWMKFLDKPYSIIAFPKLTARNR